MVDSIIQRLNYSWFGEQLLPDVPFLIVPIYLSLETRDLDTSLISHP